MSLVAHYNFLSIDGNEVEDLSGNERPMTLDGPTLTLREFDNYAVFRNDSRGIIPAFDVVGDGLTLAIKLRFDSNTTNQTILAKSSGLSASNYNWMLAFVDGRLKFRLRTSGSTKDANSPLNVVARNRDYYIFCTWNGSRMKLYLDYQIQAETSKGGSINLNPNVGIGVGNQPAGAGSIPFRGNIYEVALYNAALSQEEITNIVVGNKSLGGSGTDSHITFVGIDAWEVYASEQDANNQQNAIGSGVGNRRFNFNFFENTVYYLRVIYAGQVTIATSVPQAKGETVFNITIPYLIEKLPTKIDEVIADQLDGVNLPGIVAQAIRAELSTELARLDAPVSSRASQIGLDNIPTNMLLDNDPRLDNLDAKISTVVAPSPAQIYAHFVDGNRADVFKANVAALATQASINALNNISSLDVTAAVPSAAEIATAVEAAIINEGDGQQVVDAILQVFNQNLDLPALQLQAIAQEVRSELAIELARIDTTVSSRASQASLDATGIILTGIQNNVLALNNLSLAEIESSTVLARQSMLNTIAAGINSLNNLSLAQIEGSTVLSKEATLSTIAQAIAQIPTTGVQTDLTPVLTAIANLNDVNPAQVRSAFQTADFKDKNTEVEIHTWLDNYTNKQDWRDNLSTDDIAVAVEAAIINEGDGQQVVDAILQVFNQNLDLPALELDAIAKQVRTELSVELSRIDTVISSRLSKADGAVINQGVKRASILIPHSEDID